MTGSLPPVPLVPREVLFGNPERASPRISPDGTRLAWLAPDEGVLNVWVGSVGSDEARPITVDRDRGIRSFFWAHDNRHLLYAQDIGGDENWRLYDVDLNTDEIRDLTPFAEVQARVEETDKHFPDQILVGLNVENPELHDVYRLDLPTGELTKVVENPGFIGFLVDADFRVRGGLAPLPDGGMVGMVRDDEESEWRPVLEIGQDDALTTSPLAFTLDGAGLWMMSSIGANAGRFVKMDLATGDTEVIAEDPVYDVSTVNLHPDTREPRFVVFQKDRNVFEILDPAVADDIADLQAINPGELNVLGADDADRTWLAAFIADDGPVRYYAFDRETRQSTFLFEHQPALSDYELAHMEPFTFTSRDGLEIHGYLTFPPGVERSGLPAVLNVHGGPWRATPGASTPRPSGWPTVGTSACRSTSGGRPATGRTSSTPATASGAPRCTTTCSTPCSGSSTRATPTPTGWRSSAVPTAAMRRWSAPPSRPTSSPAPSTSSGRRT